MLNWPDRMNPSPVGKLKCVFWTLSQRVLKKGTSVDLASGGVC
jgi:hypothetical protein